MTLYLKAGPDGTSVGDCPFAHLVRIVLEEKNLDYDVRPCGGGEGAASKPTWLVEHYGGKMPALRHGEECYVESDVIAQYLDYFFRDPPLSSPKKSLMSEASEVTSKFFPALARYLKHTPDGDEEDTELKGNLESALQALEDILSAGEGRAGPFLVGDGLSFTLVDAALAPKLYHMKVGLKAFKENAIDVPAQFPAVHEYMETVFARPSFVKSVYPEEVVEWGWANARKK